MSGRPKDDTLAVAVEKLKRYPVFTLNEVKKLGVSQTTFLRLVGAGVFNRRTRGIYYGPAADEIVISDFGSACTKFPAPAFVGGLSALFLYNLLTTPPSQIWMMVPQHVQTSDKLFRLIRTKEDLSVGVIDEGQYRIASRERAIVDALRYSSIWGRSTFMYAATTAIREGKVKYVDIIRTARELGYQKLFRRYADLFSPEALGLE